MSVKSQVDGKAVRFPDAISEQQIPRGSRDGLREQLATVEDTLDESMYTGTIYYVSAGSDGDHQVMFIDTATNNGYGSTWPQWAFGLAQAALVGGKDVWLVANGDPFGSNLVYVSVLS